MQNSKDLKNDMLTRYGELLATPYPEFSEAEMLGREEKIKNLLDRLDLDALLIVEAARAGTATGWTTGWPVTAEAVTVILPDAPRTMFVQHFNHLPLAKKIAWKTDVRWGRRSGVFEGVQFLLDHGAKRIGVIGRMPPAQHTALAEHFEIRDVNADYAALRLIKSDEEIHWMGLAAALTDLGIAALAEGARPGLTERQLGALVESAFLPFGATSFLHYFLTTPMAKSTGGVPRQYASTRKLAVGDVLSTEISADFWGYTGQVLRTFFIESEPTPLYREMHDVADAALDAILSRVRPGARASELVDASALIEDANFTIIDDLVHGYGGGYLAPVLGTKSRPAAVAKPDFILEKNMCLVVQPNVVTKDWDAGVQTGHLIQVTTDGYRPLQQYTRGYQVLSGSLENT
ncbi:hypothetical protein MNBD_GAMMA13-1688 [hydrothermal vent metagenome]|uniref:Peptidase M24 domain-containing protein n=1 Tax=hydrothermal vent metagenome TaxID=652676 RepID=A0A3B0Y9R0_9ZZZZ